MLLTIVWLDEFSGLMCVFPCFLRWNSLFLNWLWASNIVSQPCWWHNMMQMEMFCSNFPFVNFKQKQVICLLNHRNDSESNSGSNIGFWMNFVRIHDILSSSKPLFVVNEWRGGCIKSTLSNKIDLLFVYFNRNETPAAKKL